MVSSRGVVTCLWFGLALQTAIARANVDQDIGRLLRNFAVRYESGSLRDVLPADSSFSRDRAALGRVRCLQLLAVAIDDISAHGSRATAKMTLLVHITEKNGGGFAEIQLRHLSVNLRELSGVWRIVDCEPSEAALARELEAPGAERVCLLNLHTDLITAELDRIILRDALKQTNRGQDEEAKRLADLAMDLAVQAGDRGGQSLALGVLGIVDRDSGETHEAVELTRQSVVIAEETGDPDVIARALINMGRAIAAGDHVSPEPASLYQRAVDLEPRLIDRTLVVRALHNIGVDLVKRLTDLRTARPYYEQSIQLAKTIGDRIGEAAAETGLAITYETNEDCGPAVPHLRRALRAAPHGTFEYDALGILAQCYIMADDLVKAERFLKIAMSGLDAPVYREGKYALLNTAAELHEKQHRTALALAEAQKGFDGLMSLGWSGDTVLPRLLIEHHRYSEAIRAIDKSLPLARKLEADTYVTYETLLGIAYRAQGRRDEAEAALREAIRGSEALRPLLGGEELLNVRRFEDLVLCYQEAVDLLVESGKPEDALRIAELQKGRELLNVLKHGHRSLAAEMDADDRAKEESIRKRLTTLNREIADAETEDLRSLRAKLDEAQAEYDAFSADVYVRNPRLKINDGAVDITTTDQMAVRLPARTAFIEYVSTNGWLDALVVRKTAAGRITISTSREPISQKTLRTRVRSFSEQLARRDLAYQAMSRSLYKLLIAPLEPDLDGVDSICILPDDALWQIPFETLLDGGGKYLIERSAISYAPSISTYLAMSSSPAPASRAAESLLAVGNPASGGRRRSELEAFYRGMTLGRLPDAEREVKTVGVLYGKSSRVYTGAGASEAAVKAYAPQSRVLHFATHAILDDHSPMFSRIILADQRSGDDDGLLEAWEVMNMHLDADLVVLSACHTAGGRVGGGEGIIGMTWAFFAAGARSIVASHWNVSSSSTSELMIAFHRALLDPHAQSRPVSSALRTAKLKMIRSAEYSHPFYWAPFVLIGADH